MKSNRKDRITKITVENFKCSRLGGIARIKMRRDYCIHEEAKDTHTDGIFFEDCANKFDCGIFVWDLKPESYHAVEPMSEACDALRMINSSGDL